MTNVNTFDVIWMDILILMRFSELPEMLKGSCLYLGILILCSHRVFMLNLEMYWAIIIYQILQFSCKHDNVGRDRDWRDWTIVVQVYISVSLIYVTCEILIRISAQLSHFCAWIATLEIDQKHGFRHLTFSCVIIHCLATVCFLFFIGIL